MTFTEFLVSYLVICRSVGLPTCLQAPLLALAIVGLLSLAWLACEGVAWFSRWVERSCAKYPHYFKE